MTFDHNFFFFSFLLKKREEEKENEVARIVIKSHAFQPGQKNHTKNKSLITFPQKFFSALDIKCFVGVKLTKIITQVVLDEKYNFDSDLVWRMQLIIIKG